MRPLVVVVIHPQIEIVLLAIVGDISTKASNKWTVYTAYTINCSLFGPVACFRPGGNLVCKKPLLLQARSKH
jgi:hypothetical protein